MKFSSHLHEDESTKLIPLKWSEKESEAVAIRWSLYALFFATCAAEIFFLLRHMTAISLDGAHSLGPVELVTVGIVAFVTFFAAYHKSHGLKNWFAWQNAIMLDIGYTLVYLVGTLLVLLAFHQAFDGVVFGPVDSSFITGAVAGIVAYLSVNAAANVDVRKIVTVFSLVLVGGILFAMATNSQPDWWQTNFSFLGSTSTAYTFNLTLIFSAIMFLVLISHVLQKFRAKRAVILRGLLIFIGITLGGIGLFPYVVGSVVLETLHYISADSMIIAFVVLIGIIPWLVPKLSKEFLILTYIVEVGLFVSYCLSKFFHTITVTAFEFASFGMCFAWLVILFKNIILSADNTSSP